MSDVVSNEVGPVAKPTMEARRQQEQDERDLNAWFSSFGPLGEVRVAVKRLKPEDMTIRGTKVNIAGHLKTYEDVLDEDRIKAEHGGGTYELILKVPNEKGSFVFKKSRTVRISGQPLPPDDVMESMGSQQAQQHAAEPTPLALKAMEKMSDLLDSERNKVAPVTSQALTKDLIDQVQGPLLDALKESREETKDLRKQVIEIVKAPKEPVVRENTAVEKMLDKMVDGETARVNALRMQFDSERNSLTTYWQGQVQRAEDNARRSLDTMEKSHEREIRTLEKSHEQALANAKVSSDATVKSLEREVARLERELTAKDAELGQLRAQKQESVLEQIDKLKAIKDAFSDGDDKEEEGSTAERIIGTILTSNPVAAIASRIAGQAAPTQQAPANPQQQVQQQFEQLAASMPARKPFEFMGQYYVKTDSGQVAKIRPRKGTKAAQATKAPVDPSAPAQEEQPDITEEDMANAVVALEGAINSRTSPAEFALTAKIMAPKAVAIVRKFGIDKLISLAKLSDDSPILTQRGKTFLREMAEALTT
jgi:hypothetical protein